MLASTQSHAYPWLSYAFCLTLAVLVLAPSALADAFCATEGPESVLPCMVRAYKARDIGMLDELYSSDYVFQFRDNPTPWGWEEHRLGIERVFADPNVKDVTVNIIREPRIIPGATPGTWVLEDAHLKLTSDTAKESGEPVQYKADKDHQWFFVRKVLTPEVHFEVYRWEDRSTEP